MFGLYFFAYFYNFGIYFIKTKEGDYMLERYFDPQLAKKFDEYNLVQEIRIRSGRKVSVIDRTGIHKTDITFNSVDITKLFSSLCNYSVYALHEEIKNGFITLTDGHRAGFCGRCIVQNGIITNITDISGINIRIAREIKGCSENIMKFMDNGIENMVIISPPNCGKTTYLRDAIRLVSDSGVQVTVVDERGEISPFYEGSSVFDMGENTDVMRFCPKAVGMMMVLRTMNPEIVATDEIGTKQDIVSIKEICKSGVKIFTTFHGFGVSDFKSRFEEWKTFKYAVVLNRTKEVEELTCLR